MIRPWVQRQNESKEQFAAFESFLSAGPTRNLGQVVSNARPLYLVVEWSKRFGWVARAKAFDRWTESRADVEPTPESIAACHNGAFLHFSQVLYLESRKWLQTSLAGDMPGAIDLKDCIKLLEYFKPAKKTLDVNVTDKGAGNPQFTDEEFEALEAIFAKRDANAGTEH